MSSCGRRVEEVTSEATKLISQEFHHPWHHHLEGQEPMNESGKDTYAGNSTMLHWQNILVQCHLSFSFCECRFPQNRTARNWDQLHFVCRQDFKENHLVKYLLFPFYYLFFCLKLSIYWLYIVGFLMVFSYVPIKYFDHMYPMPLLVPPHSCEPFLFPTRPPFFFYNSPFFFSLPHPYVCIPGSFIKVIRRIWAPDQQLNYWKKSHSQQPPVYKSWDTCGLSPL